MAGNQLSIKVLGSLDTAQTKTKINEQLATIEKKINNIKLGVDVSLLTKLGKQVEQLQKQINQQSKGIRIIDDKEAAKNIDRIQEKTRVMFTSIEKAIKEYSKLGTVKFDTNINPVTKQLEGFNLVVEKADKTLQKLKFDMAQIGTPTGMKSVYELTALKGSNNTQAIREKNLQQEQAIQNTINKQNQSLQHQVELFKQQQQLNAKNLQNNYGNKVDTNAINNWLNAVNQLDSSTPHVNQQMQNLRQQFREISSEAQNSGGVVKKFGESLKSAFTSMASYAVTGAFFYAPIRALNSMIDRLVQIDTLMTNINRVMEIPEFKLNELLSEAVNISDTLGSKLEDVLSVMDNFGRMGFSENQLADITKTAQVLQNISDLNAQDSVDTLTSAMLNFNIAAQDSITISDKLNEVDNNYAITTKDLSDSIRKAAATAKTFGVTLDELNGYTAAIGSTTRETGTIIGKIVADIKSFLIDLEPLTLSRGRQGASVMVA